MSEFRVEYDTLGEVRLPAQAYFGAQTQRAVENFPISGQTMPPELIHAFALVKWAAAVANRDLGKLTGTGKNPLNDRQVEALLAAAREVAAGKFDDQFPVDVYQTGSGTSTNMNVNEVIANRAIELAGGDRLDAKKSIHPNDHVNMGQSTNDMFPTTIHVAVALAIRNQLIPALHECGAALSAKAKEWEKVLKIGRTHLIDATPLALGQEIGGMARQLDRSVGRAGLAMEAVLELPVGGTAVGSGINTHPQFARRVCEILAKETGIPLHRGGRSLRGQRPARRPGRVPRPDPHHRRHALHRGQQRPLAQFRPADRASTKSPCPTFSRAARSCRARSIR